MYKAVLVDDESIIRNAVSRIIDWADFDFELIATCSNALEAIEVINSAKVDLVITDICMPHMDGLELSEWIYERHLNIVIVIISGYDDFNYAKTAIKYNVSEYLLKPVTAEEFNRMLEKVRTLLDDRRGKEEYIKKIRDVYDENKFNLKNRFLEGLMSSSSSMSADYISKRLEEFQPELDGPCYCCAVFEPLPLETENESRSLDSLSNFSLFSVARDIVSSMKAGEAFQDVSNRTIVYFSAESRERVKELAAEVCAEIHAMAVKLLCVQLNISIGRPVYSLHKIPVSYQSAQSLMENFFLAGCNRIIESSDTDDGLSDSAINRSEWEDKLLSCIKKNRLQELDFLLEQFIETMRRQQFSKTRAILDIQSLILSVMNYLEQGMYLTDEILKKEQSLLDKMAVVPLSDIEPCLRELCHNAAESVRSKCEGYNQTQAKLAMDYIRKNYGRSDLSLADICGHLSMSTSRFSSVFKENTGETFIEALTRVRMEAAKELLVNTRMKGYEIAERVGFVDPHYFGITFKKNVGMTPTEYAKANRNF